MSDLKRFKKDYSLDGWPIRDNENSLILHADDLVVILNDFDRLEKSINKLKAEAVREATKFCKIAYSCLADDLEDYAGRLEQGVIYESKD